MFRELDSEIYRIMESLITFLRWGIKKEINELSSADIFYPRLSQTNDLIPPLSLVKPFRVQESDIAVNKYPFV
jgi:hypothetical protein